MLDEAGRARDRLVRHELTHVAIGAGDDRAPVWLSEGLAEYVSVQPLPPERRTISEAAIEAARAGVTEMPADDSFNDAGTPGRASANYGIAWFACEYLASSYGEVTLWQLLSVAQRARRGRRPACCSAQVGINVRTLARKAGKLILTTYSEQGLDQGSVGLQLAPHVLGVAGGAAEQEGTFERREQVVRDGVHVDGVRAVPESLAQQQGVALAPGDDRRPDRGTGLGPGELALGEHRDVETARLLGHQDVRVVLEEADEGQRPLDRVRYLGPGGERLLQVRDIGGGVPLHERPAELGLRREVVEERALGRRGGRQHPVDRGGRKTVLDHQLLGCVEDAVAGRGSVPGHVNSCTRPISLL